MEIKRWFSLILRHGAPLGLFILVPMLVALFLGHNIITLEQNQHINGIQTNLENSLIDFESELVPESFMLKVAHGAWYTFDKNKGDLDNFWKYYKKLNNFLGSEVDIYTFDKNGSLITPREFNLKSRFMADKLWETQGNSYVETAELYKKLKKQFKNFLGNEFKLSAFLEGRNKLIPIIVKTRNGFVFWMNSSDNPKEGILMIFWEMPSVKFRTEQMLKRYANRFYDCFLKGSDESFWSVETSSENDNAHIFEVKNEAQKNNYDMVSRNISILGNNDRFIDEKGLLWKGCKLDDNWFFVAAKTNFNKYNNYHTYFLYFMILLGIAAVCVYVWTVRREAFYLSIRTKLVSLFLIAVFTPVMGFSYMGYQYVSDMKANLLAAAGNEARELLLNIDRDLGGSGNIFKEDFKKLIEDLIRYDSNSVCRKHIVEALESYELGNIEWRCASDASLINQIYNEVLFEDMNEVTKAFSKACIDTMMGSNLCDSLDPILKETITSPEIGMNSFYARPDNVQDFVFGNLEFYLYWDLRQNSKGDTEYFMAMRSTDKVLRESLMKRIKETATRPRERAYRIIARNDRNGMWFPDSSLSKPLKEFSRRVDFAARPLETEIDIDSKHYLILGMKSKKLRGYSFFALYPYENIENRLIIASRYLSFAVIFFVIIALAIGFILSDTFLYPVKRLGDGVKAIKSHNSEFRIEALQNDEFGDLADSFNKMISDLKEMELAKYIQESLLPHSIPQMNGYELCFSNRMASAVGGDYFDAKLLDENNLCIIIGDVSGHGVASALVMAIAKAVLYHGFNETRDLIKLFEDLNMVINTYFNKPPVKKMITLFATIINLQTGQAVFTDAGHNFPMKISADGTVTEISMVGLPVGVMKKLRKAHTDEYTIGKGESIVFYTDGIVEVTGKTEEQYGYNRFKSVLSANASKSANEIMSTLFNYYDNWLSGTEPDDDVTLVVLKRKIM